MPFFSVIVPSYNSEQYIGACLDSVLCQTCDDFELIIVDDGATDASPRICDDYAQQDGRVRVIHTKNSGSVAARRRGLREARGEYVLSVDSDDLVDRDLLRTIRSVVEKHHPDVIAFGYREMDQDGNLGKRYADPAAEGLYTQEKLAALKKRLICDVEQRKHNMGALSFSAWSKAMKRPLALQYQELTPDGIKNGEDLAAVMPAICHADSVYVLSKTGYYYRVFDASMVRSFRENELAGIRKVIEHLQTYAVGVPENNIKGYAFQMVMGQSAMASRTLGSYREFKQYVEKNIDGFLWESMEGYSHPKLNWFCKFRKTLIMRRRWRLYWLLCRYIH